MNPEDENVLPFISELKNKVAGPGAGAAICLAASCSPDPGAAGAAAAAARASSPPGAPPLLPLSPAGPGGGLNGLCGEAGRSSASLAKFEGLQGRRMPFELKALEVCLESVRGCRTLGEGGLGGLSVQSGCQVAAKA
jgi:hypothetical protein